MGGTQNIAMRESYRYTFPMTETLIGCARCWTDWQNPEGGSDCHINRLAQGPPASYHGARRLRILLPPPSRTKGQRRLFVQPLVLSMTGERLCKANKQTHWNAGKNATLSVKSQLMEQRR